MIWMWGGVYEVGVGVFSGFFFRCFWRKGGETGKGFSRVFLFFVVWGLGIVVVNCEELGFFFSFG